MLLALIDDKRQLVCKNLTFYVYENGSVSYKIASIKASIIKVVLSRNRLASRLCRLEPRCVAHISENIFIVCFLHKVWSLDIQKRQIVELCATRPGFSDPLNICTDEECAYFGDYGNNPLKEVVNVYHISPLLTVDVIYQFPKGQVRHIHNIIYDKSLGGFWVLTGDTEKQAGIYWANRDWSDVKPIMIGEQDYRAVIAFPYKGGLLYATDAVDRENHIYYLNSNIIEKIADINGSCIHGTEIKDYFVFSTTVEPPEGRGVKSMFTYQLGAGIKSNESHIIVVNKKTLNVEVVGRLKKDIWPLKLFQYGMALFPIGQENSDVLYFDVLACKGDGNSFVYTFK